MNKDKMTHVLENIIQEIAKDLSIEDIENGEGIMGFGARLGLGDSCAKLSNLGYSEKSINQQIKLIRQSIKQDKNFTKNVLKMKRSS